MICTCVSGSSIHSGQRNSPADADLRTATCSGILVSLLLEHQSVAGSRTSTLVDGWSALFASRATGIRRASRNSRATESTRIYSPSRTPLPGQAGRPLAEPRAYRVVASTMCTVHDAPRVRAFEQAFNLIDPARDTDSWGGLRATILDMVEAMDVSPPASEISSVDGWNDAASCEIERQLDAVVPGEIIAEFTGRSRSTGARAFAPKMASSVATTPGWPCPWMAAL